MARRRRSRFTFHGAYKTKKRAKRHEKRGEFILKRKIKGHTRWVLLKPR